MKYLKLTRVMAFIALGSMIFMACKKVNVPVPMGDAGQTLVKLLGGGTPANSVTKSIDFLPTPISIVAVEVRRDVPNNAELNKTMVVTVLDDTAAVTIADSTLVHLDPTWYTIQTDGVKAGGEGGTYTLTFAPGQFSISINIIITNPTMLDPSTIYGLGFTLLTADGSAKVSTQKSIVVEIGAKNDYDGIYSVESGWVQRYTAPGSPEPVPGPSGLNGDLTGNSDVIMATVGAYTVEIPGSCCVGRLEWANASGGSGVAGIDGLKITVDPATNLTTALSSGYAASNATFGNWAGHTNDYDPATRTFRQAWRWNPASTIREYEVVLKWKGPR